MTRVIPYNSYLFDVYHHDGVYIKIKEKISMIIGKISKGEKRTRFNVEIYCTNCKKKVPGGLQTGEKYYQTREFKIELEEFKEKYLCGICRDKKRWKSR